ncbi:MAG: hypothetical protein R2758_05965 [Bacteroidales bacterium]
MGLVWLAEAGCDHKANFSSFTVQIISASWKQVSGLTEETKTYMERHSGTYGWVFCQIRVADPKNEKIQFTRCGIQLHQSTDGGQLSIPFGSVHVDHHGSGRSGIIPTTCLMQDGGLTISYDKGVTWKYPTDVLSCTAPQHRL